MNLNINNFLKQYNLQIKNEQLLIEALTHSSYTNENRGTSDYQRLEFLGDTILSFTVGEHLFKKYKNLNEGQMSLLRSSLVSSEKLAQISLEIGLDKLIRTGKSLKNISQNQKILADIFEAFIAALFLDQGLKTVKKFLNKVLLNKRLKTKNQELKNPKTLLQEHLQSSSRKIIQYQTKKVAEGFQARISYDNLILGQGVGKTKQTAEVVAAQDALNKLKNTKDNH